MGIQMTAVVKQGSGYALSPAPYEVFANNSNVAAYNQIFIDMYADEEFCRMHHIIVSNPPLAPQMDLTIRRQTVFKTYLGIGSFEQGQYYAPKLVKELANKLQECKTVDSETISTLFDMEYQDFMSTIEFFEICAANNYGFTFA